MSAVASTTKQQTHAHIHTRTHTTCCCISVRACLHQPCYQQESGRCVDRPCTLETSSPSQRPLRGMHCTGVTSSEPNTQTYTQTQSRKAAKGNRARGTHGLPCILALSASFVTKCTSSAGASTAIVSMAVMPSSLGYVVADVVEVRARAAAFVRLPTLRQRLAIMLCMFPLSRIERERERERERQESED